MQPRVSRHMEKTVAKQQRARTDRHFYTVDEIKSRQSISTLIFYRYRPIDRASLAELTRCGIRRIELLECPDQFDMTNPPSMKLVADTCRDSGIDIVAYHAHKTNFANLETEADRIRRVDRCKRQVDTLLDLGGRIWASHAQADDDVMRKSFEELARHVEGSPAVLAVENFGRNGTTVEGRMAFLDGLNHPQVGLLLDTGHLWHDREQIDGRQPLTVPGGPTKYLDLCGRRLVHLHMHGFIGTDHYPPMIEGDQLQWVELFAKLYALGYPGPLNFEPLGYPRDGESPYATLNCERIRTTIEAVARVPERIVEAAGKAHLPY